jgi:phospholipid/cholesterol/gamma-HCH transport system substrate-binding protein
MKRSVIETVLGAVVLVLAGFFLAFSYKTADVRKVSGYEITASFSGTGGLAVGNDVRISGVRIGSVTNLTLDQKNYLARVTMSIDPSVKLPDDTAAIISSDSLLGGRYLELQPGASDDMLKPGGKLQYTQAPQNLEELLGKFIFSMQGAKKDEQQTSSAPGPDKPAPKSPADQTPAAAPGPDQAHP